MDGVSVSVTLDEEIGKIKRTVTLRYDGLPSHFVAKELLIEASAMAESILNPQVPQANNDEPNLESGRLQDRQSGVSK